VLLARVAGMDPRHFGGRNLLAEIEKRRRGDGSISGFVSYTAFGVMALRASGASAGSATIQWLLSSQNTDGGFGVARSSASDSDMTGAALQALATVGRAHGPAAQRAAEWLRSNQNGDGGFGQFKGRDSNAQSTAYAIQGLLAAGAGGNAASRARAYLVRLQRRDGSVAYSSTSSQTPVWVTAQALMALEGKPLPLAAVPRKERAGARASSDGKGGGASAAGGGGGGGKSGGSKRGAGGSGGATASGQAGSGEVGGVKAESGSGAAVPEAAPAPGVQTAPQSGAAEVKPVPVWAALLALAGLLALLWGLHRYVLPGR
jgi:Squalene-hopene cyclase C-terminal domain